ncbi:amino acid--tRNA ligase-related protein [Plantactinospora soyae]|uniref:Aspartyl/asparaginyl-tRNA synthetase n=1 Tax=Plantactinospora soyae TaxID=1544732 RepID=A0A927R7J6_9ACTN|nr:amino acid--tRNA ligase-related protein [Plantactinospora soyae]MBE1489509.1 aspartyl/asparaginyl-tRNA synthetase [Plantactinospora soyae]
MTTALHIEPTRSWTAPQTHYLTAMTSSWYRMLVELQDTLTSSTVAFWSERGLRFGHLPITTGSISSPMGRGSDSRPVEVSMFGVQTYLADSMQFGLEYLCRLSPRGAYYLMPSFRGEATDGTHLAQFFHSEAEVPGGLDVVLPLVEAYVRRLTTDLLAAHESQLASAVGGEPAHLYRLLDRTESFGRFTFDEAAELLGHDPRYIRSEAGWRTMTRAGEAELMRRAGDFVWVTHWDHQATPFYQAVDDRGRALNGDLLFGPGEVVGCGERHATAAAVRAALASHGVSADTYDWYLQMKETAPLQTAGFGLGVERFLMWLTGNADIRDFAIFLRENGSNIVP